MTGARLLDHMTASLRVRNFRLFALGQLASVTGTWMMVTAQDWLVLRMTDDSAAALGAVTAAQFAPVLLLTLVGGRLADRLDRRRLLVVANTVSGLLALALALAVLSDRVSLGHVIACAVGVGLVNAVEIPVRMSFIGELVDPELVPNASALSAAYFNVARVLGPATAGLLIDAAGVGAVMLLNAASYLATVAGLHRIRPAELRRTDERRAQGGVAAGLRYVAGRTDLILPLVLTAVVALVGFNFQVTLPLLARTVFHTDAGSFGLLTAGMAVGSLLAALATTLRRGRPGERTVLVGATAFGVMLSLSGMAPTFTTALICLSLTGAAMLAFAQSANHHVQLGSDPAYRGRVMALYTLLLQGTTPFGALLTGRLADRLGARGALSVSGVVCLAAVLAAWACAAARRPGICAPRRLLSVRDSRTNHREARRVRGPGNDPQDPHRARRHLGDRRPVVEPAPRGIRSRRGAPALRQADRAGAPEGRDGPR
ncbi:MFS transporter [Streptomyces cylindrosporus]|uniref:MFS transporter n=1 Tax=Streptomyces cylindrosporus TaxID=2927583 RepID=A0ABS9YNG6_9ACTN|nr:MFS transporter [Streptomyces cylindrosporus]MCI3278828.1 MFS transporter [Streptomyces cylindrosporus]